MISINAITIYWSQGEQKEATQKKIEKEKEATNK